MACPIPYRAAIITDTSSREKSEKKIRGHPESFQKSVTVNVQVCE